jgi:hypothetical protein
MKKRKGFYFRSLSGLLGLALFVSACGPQAFVPGVVRSRQSAAGSITIPAKVDVVFGLSQNMTMLNIFPGLQSEVSGFMNKLQNSGWNYRFVGIPLGYNQINSPAAFPITGKVAVSRYDNNTPQVNWLPPYPGADYNDPLLGIASNLVSTTFAYPAPSVSSGDTVYGLEYGLRNQAEFLTRSDVQSNFLRPDALLAVITLSNGEDRSYGTPPAPGTTGAWTYNTSQMNAAISAIHSVKSTPGLVKYYAMVNHLNLSCRGAGTWSGIRYETFADSIGGGKVDICTVPLASAFSAVAQNIQGTPLPFRRNFLTIASEPKEGTVRVIRYANGDTNSPVEIQEDPTNGWTYSGYLTNQATIDYPVAMDVRTGYMIELHGTARLNGADSADVVYQNIGTVTSQ